MNMILSHSSSLRRPRHVSPLEVNVKVNVNSIPHQQIHLHQTAATAAAAAAAAAECGPNHDSDFASPSVKTTSTAKS